MRCYEARYRLSRIDRSGSEGSSRQIAKDLLDHLSSCPECSLLHEAAGMLARATKTLKASPQDDQIPLSIIKTRVEARLDDRRAHSLKENALMSTIQRQLRRRPRLGLGLALSLVALLAATVIPIKYDKTIGYQVAVAGVDRELAIDGTKLSEMLVQLGYDEAAIDVTNCSKTCDLIISRLDSEDDAKVVMAAFNELASGFECKLGLVFESATGNFFEAAHGKAFRIVESVDGIGPDDQAHRFVTERLGEDGGSIKFTFEATDGNRGYLVGLIPDMAEFTEDGLHWIAKDGVSESFNIKIISSGDSPGAAGWLNTIMECGTLMDSSCKILISGGGVGCLAGGDIGEGRAFLKSIDMANLSEDDISKLAANGWKVTITEDENGEQHIALSYVSATNQDIWSQDDNVSLGPDDGPSPSDPGNLPEKFSLSQNYPNPFNPTTQIAFELPSSGHVRLDIYNIRGQKVRTLIDGVRSAGQHTVEWDATSDAGSQLASGTYFYRLTAGELVQKKKMTLLK